MRQRIFQIGLCCFAVAGLFTTCKDNSPKAQGTPNGGLIWVAPDGAAKLYKVKDGAQTIYVGVGRTSGDPVSVTTW